MSTPYLPPLDQLLSFGIPRFGHRNPWPDYVALGFTAEHVPELIRMTCDDVLDAGDENDAATYAGIHAWRTLGQLRAEAAIEPLIDLMEMDGDWPREEVPTVLGMIGPAAIEPLRLALSEWSRDADEPWPAGAAGSGLAEVAGRFPETRDTVVAILVRQLRWWGRQWPILNTMLIDDLIDLKATEAAPLIEEVFAAGAADTELSDDWEDVQVRLGLLPERITPRPPYVPRFRLRPIPDGRGAAPRPAGDTKRRRKAEKAARQRNRKRR